MADFVERRDLLSELMAASTYNINTGELAYDPAIFDPESRIGRRDIALPLQKKPSFQEAFRDSLLLGPFSKDLADKAKLTKQILDRKRAEYKR